MNYVNGKSASQVNRSYKDGLVTQEFLKEYGATTSLKTLYEYDSYGRVIKKTTPLNFVSTYTYNPKGLLYSVKNHKEQETTFEYDDWGRKVIPLDCTYTYSQNSKESFSL